MCNRGKKNVYLTLVPVNFKKIIFDTLYAVSKHSPVRVLIYNKERANMEKYHTVGPYATRIEIR